jgi:hypothetical protein
MSIETPFDLPRSDVDRDDNAARAGVNTLYSIEHQSTTSGIPDSLEGLTYVHIPPLKRFDPRRK